MRGHVPVGPVLGTANGATARVEHDNEPGKVLVDRAETIISPCSQAGTATDNAARIHHQQSGTVNGRVGGHGVEKSDIVNTFGKVWKQIRHPLATLPVLFEFPAWFNDASFVLVTTTTKRLDIDRLVIHAGHLWLAVKRINMARTTVHEQEDYILCFRLKVWLLGSQWIHELTDPIGSQALLSQEAIVTEQPCQGN